MEVSYNPILNVNQVLSLYESVGWTNYTKNPQMLEVALERSLLTIAVFDQERLVGLLRAVGDGASILFIQDLLVLPAYQRQGIGRQLVQACLANYPEVYQVHLLTDQTEKTATFYQSLGFQGVEELACRAFTLVK
ncbi:GNAT family N-acetyltransferase [Streptococcus gallinaceus]|uniref:GNAT superfamily N-acetyltransferase n=1 Tax=Streptococcus gallinaceus TaxID=165758 RepID=A0ABV2JI48_9STRE|nr:GNAT family N-acetyltransferase [Streptococcus gallinaceus]MCP1638429.1 GNAT superfamily N-acetyltransferase [Streptococcus gallinaceus]MCP1769484.1 GNAT superfamily N-acetyltransferase [Streptococcus gallinaceus]